jgi:hypothetical protein
VCYTPKEKSSPITYVLAGALRLQQYGLTTGACAMSVVYVRACAVVCVVRLTRCVR